MTQKLIVLTGFKKLSDSQALATAGAVMKETRPYEVLALVGAGGQADGGPFIQ